MRMHELLRFVGARVVVATNKIQFKLKKNLQSWGRRWMRAFGWSYHGTSRIYKSNFNFRAL